MSAGTPFPTARLVGTPPAGVPPTPPAPPVTPPAVATAPALSDAAPPAPAAPATSATTAPAPGLAAFSAPAPSGTSPGTIAAGALLLGLAVAALVMSRKRRRTGRLVEIVESASLGPRRALVVARLGDELLVLGSSEGGVSLLATRPAHALETARAPAPAHRAAPPAASAPPRAPAADLLGRLRDRLAPRRADRFATALAESVEDAELRRKLAAGQGVRVP